MLTQGFDAPNLFIQPARLVYSWAHEEDWESVTQRSAFAEGDLARLILRTAENLRQVSKLKSNFPAIASSAKEAVDILLREPIVTFYS